jgi:hypothetical protein
MALCAKSSTRAVCAKQAARPAGEETSNVASMGLGRSCVGSSDVAALLAACFFQWPALCWLAA